MKTTIMNEPEQGYFFWLGEDGEIEPVTKDQFEAEINNERVKEQKRLNVDID